MQLRSHQSDWTTIFGLFCWFGFGQRNMGNFIVLSATKQQTATARTSKMETRYNGSISVADKWHPMNLSLFYNLFTCAKTINVQTTVHSIFSCINLWEWMWFGLYLLFSDCSKDVILFLPPSDWFQENIRVLPFSSLSLYSLILKEQILVPSPMVSIINKWVIELQNMPKNHPPT